MSRHDGKYVHKYTWPVSEDTLMSPNYFRFVTCLMSPEEQTDTSLKKNVVDLCFSIDSRNQSFHFLKPLVTFGSSSGTPLTDLAENY